MLKLVNSNRDALMDYLCQQVAIFFPDGQLGIREAIDRQMDEALVRLERCINVVRMWSKGEFDYLHTSQYAIFLYFLSNALWRYEQNQRLCAKLFSLNKALNGIDLFYEIEMPRYFMMGHTAGIVFAKATYGEYCVFCQGCTVGRYGLPRPVLENGVIMFPGSMIIGDCLVRENTVIAPNVTLVNTETPGNCYVFQGEKGRLVFKELKRYYADEYFVRT